MRKGVPDLLGGSSVDWLFVRVHARTRLSACVFININNYIGYSRITLREQPFTLFKH